MKLCSKCGAELSDGALLCRECGTAQTADAQSQSSFFSMPYLSSESATSTTNSAQTEKKNASAVSNVSPSVADKKKEKIRIDQITDPRERAFAKQDKRNRMIRIAILIAVIVLAIAGGIYLLVRNSGYHRTLQQYIDGRTDAGGSKYTAIVPEVYLLEAESAYDMSRPEIRSNVNDYLEHVENQLIADYGGSLEFPYKIITETTVTNEETLDALEESIFSTYHTTVNISEAAYVTIRLTTKGSETKTTETKNLTFFKHDGKWCSLDAMQNVQFACENAGYGMW